MKDITLVHSKVGDRNVTLALGVGPGSSYGRRIGEKGELKKTQNRESKEKLRASQT